MDKLIVRDALIHTNGFLLLLFLLVFDFDNIVGIGMTNCPLYPVPYLQPVITSICYHYYRHKTSHVPWYQIPSSSNFYPKFSVLIYYSCPFLPRNLKPHQSRKCDTPARTLELRNSNSSKTSHKKQKDNQIGRAKTSG